MTVFEVQEKDGTKRIRKPSGLKPALGKLVMSFIYIAYYTVIGSHYGMSTLSSKEFLGSSLFYRFWYAQFSSFNTRIKYYIVWTMAEGSCILSGLGFNGYDPVTGHALWNRVANIDVIDYEKAQNCKELLESWNKRTNVWLRNYVYLRLTPIGKKPSAISTFATFGTSALWHGFYPGYYLTFATGALTQQAAKTLRRNLRPMFLAPDLKTPLPSKKAYDIVSWFVTQVTFNYVVIPFGILELRESYVVWRSLVFYVHIGIFTVEGLNMIGVGGYLRAIQKKRAEAAGFYTKTIKASGRVDVNELRVTEHENIGGIQAGKGKVE
jgi:lysophospholipid acyltransferase